MIEQLFGWILDLLSTIQLLFRRIKIKFAKNQRSYEEMHQFSQQQEATDFDLQYQHNQNNKQQTNKYLNTIVEPKQNNSNHTNNLNDNISMISYQRQKYNQQNKLDLNPQSNIQAKISQVSQKQLDLQTILNKIKIDLQNTKLQKYQHLVSQTLNNLQTIFSENCHQVDLEKSDYKGIQIFQYPSKNFKYKISYQVNCTLQQYSQFYTDIQLQKSIFETTSQYQQIEKIYPYFKKYMLQLKKFMILQKRSFYYYKLTRKNDLFAWSLCIPDQQQKRQTKSSITGTIVSLNIFKALSNSENKLQITSYFDIDLCSALRAQKIIQRGLIEIAKQIKKSIQYINSNYNKR